MTALRLRRIVVVVVLFGVLAGACGDDDESSTDASAPTETEAPSPTEAPAQTEAPATSSSETSTEAEPEETTDADGGDEVPDAAALAGLEVIGVRFDTGEVQIANDGTEPLSLEGLWICQRPDYMRLPPIPLDPSTGIIIDLPGGADAAGGEAAIYLSDDFGDGANIVSYVHWGSGGGRASLAEDAGEWSGPAVGSDPVGIFLEGEPGSADGWG